MSNVQHRLARGGRTTVVAAAFLMTISVGGALAVPATTVPVTIADRDGDNRLEPGPGEGYVVRADLGTPAPRRESRRIPLLTFGHQSDMHVVDEESPLRFEYLDKLGPPLTSAYRPQEGITAQVLEQMVKQVRNTVSPVTRERIKLVMTTGDNTDNTQLNETRWMIDLMDGGKTIDPDSGIAGTCGTAPLPTRRYDGVRGGNEYYEPDSSSPPGADSEDGPGYSPDQAENEREAQRSSSVRDFSGLYEQMQDPFRSTGYDAPWYSIFGNHDALIAGNGPRNPAQEAIATGCVKVRSLPPATQDQIAAIARAALKSDPGPLEEALPGLPLALDQATAALTDPAAFAAAGGVATTVPQDPRRRPLKKREYINEHFQTGGQPVGHGFTAANQASGQGNFVVKPRPGVRFLVLDSVAENGGANGNIDETQFQWIHDQLRQAEAAREVVFAFAHHSLRTMNEPPASAFPPGDQGGDATPLVHFGEGARGEQPSQCVVTDPVLPPTPDETLRCLFLRHPSVVGFVVGHEHLNRVAPVERRPGAGKAAGGFWEITSPAHIDWPQQSRLLDLLDNRDGSLSIFGTMIDHAAPAQPGGPPPRDGGAAAANSTSRLASISRELSFNDPDSDNGQDGRQDARGTRQDRNVELLVRNPYPPAG